MSKISIIAKLTARPHRFEALVTLAREMAATALSEPGTEVFIMSTSVEETTVWFFEVFTNEEALNDHRDSIAMKNFGPTLQRVAEPEFESHQLRLLDAKGLA